MVKHGCNYVQTRVMHEASGIIVVSCEMVVSVEEVGSLTEYVLLSRLVMVSPQYPTT
jgi:hypothetical protein